MARVKHAKAAANYIHHSKNPKAQHNAASHLRKKRDREVINVPGWEHLRETASQIKMHTLSNLDKYLEEFERKATQNGVKVHWAQDGNEMNEIVYGILDQHQVPYLVKSKSMLTEECHLNDYLEKRGIDVFDTDLGERIVQLSKETPSHIVVPAMHKTREDISELFHDTMKTEKGNLDAKYLTLAARKDLREKFMNARAALTGVNFGVAETGTVTIATNEGNADLGVNKAPVQIHCMGLEKMVPRQMDLSVFLRLLGRSATGQSITTYSSHYQRPKPGGEMHIVLVDNGRSKHLGMEDFWTALKCIRCGACMNTCPVYRSGGGHSYGYTVPGPIGSIITPARDINQYDDLPFASSLCGSCSDVCPVKIDIHGQLLKWREVIVDHGIVDKSKSIPMKMGSKVLSKPSWYRFAGSIARKVMKQFPGLVSSMVKDWTRGRELPEVPKESFRSWYIKNKKKNDK
ncbi:lactate utilization protein B [Membranihabitans maritimus]|uniref:lactate utilization protein B n=1 Tax=Membranihabitans maritimus TaxID=2904244 RepID=UPI001F358877|nr:lactate utilization protein B [Membranihabitans maritimus]